MTHRTFNPDLVNEIAAKTLDGGPYDFSTVVLDKKNHVFVEDGFCAMFCWSAPSVYECHVMGVPEARGAHAMRVGRDMLRTMQMEGASMIWGQPAQSDRAAQCYIRRMGLKEVGDGQNPVIGPVRYFVLEDVQCLPL